MRMNRVMQEGGHLGLYLSKIAVSIDVHMSEDLCITDTMHN